MVDDAIVVLENIVRHVEKGMEPFAAALRGAREMGFTIISISISLVAVFIPIFFMPGVIGLLFHEFAVVVGLAMMVSAVVSLTLVPMLCEPPAQAQRRTARRPRRAHPSRALRSAAPSSAASPRCATATRARSTGAARTAPLMLMVAASTFALTALAVHRPSRRASSRRRTSARSRSRTEAAEDISFPAMMALQDQRGRSAAGTTRAWTT